MNNILTVLFVASLFSCSSNYRNKVEQTTNLDLGNSFVVLNTESLDAIGKIGFIVEFQIEDQFELSGLTEKIESLSNFSSTYSERLVEQEFWWYKKGELYIMEVKQQNPRVGFILNKRTGKGKYSYFEE